MPVLLAPEKFGEAVEEEPVREEGRSVTGFCERVREGKASVFCRLLEEEASLREASKERIEARFLMMPRLQPT